MSGEAAVDSRIEQLMRAFEDATLEPAGFNHEVHILVGWRYLQELSLPDAISRFTAAIKRLTAKLGLSSRYHETITWFYLIKIAERRSADWSAFKAANPDLFARNPSLVDSYYSKALLASDRARRSFVFPDCLT